jgi:hypothetical protein
VKKRDDGYVEFQALDAQNFSTVYADFIYYVGNNISKANAVINRQITLCQDIKNFTNGSYMKNAKFTMAYLYTSAGTNAPVTSANTAPTRRGAFGTNDTDRLKVTVNSYTQWDSEDISIIFQ